MARPAVKISVKLRIDLRVRLTVLTLDVFRSGRKKDPDIRDLKTGSGRKARRFSNTVRIVSCLPNFV